MRKETKATRPWILHGFRGGIEQWRQLSKTGLHISIGKHYNTELIKQLPLQQLLIESDDSTEIDKIYNSISKDTGITVFELQQFVRSNIFRLFKDKT